MCNYASDVNVQIDTPECASFQPYYMPDRDEYGMTAEQRRFHEQVNIVDGMHRVTVLQSRAVEISAAQVVRPPPTVPAPFHGENHTFDAAITGVSKVSGKDAPRFLHDKSDPEAVYSWVTKTMLEWGHQCKNEGKLESQQQIGLGMSRQDAAMFHQLMALSYECLTNARL